MAPPPGWVAPVSAPPWRSTMARAIDRPSPACFWRAPAWSGPMAEEAVEDAPGVLGRDAGAVIADANEGRRADPPHLHLDRLVGRREAARVVEQVVEHLAQAIGGRVDDDRRPARHGQRDAGAVAGPLAHQRGEIDRPPLLRFQPGVHARHLAHAGDQRLEPGDVGGDAGVEAGAILGPLGDRQRLGGRPDRRQRVAQLVRHVGGEALGEAQVRVEPPGQLLQRARQLADLVAPRRAAEGAQAAAVVIDQRLGVVAELPQRAHDGQRGDDGEGEGHRQRDHHHLEHPQPHVVQPLQDPERRLRDEHHVADPAVTRDRPRAVERHRSLAAGRQPGRGAVAPGERAVDLGRLDAARGRRGSSPRPAAAPRSRSASASVARTTRRRGTSTARAAPASPGRWSPPVSSRPSRPGTRCESATTRPSGAMIRSRTSDDCSRRSSSRCGAEPAADRGQVGELGERRREEPRLLHHRPLLLLEQVLLVGVEIPEPGDRQEDEQRVEQEQPDRQPRVSARQARRPRPDAAHRSSVRRR